MGWFSSWHKFKKKETPVGDVKEEVKGKAPKHKARAAERKASPGAENILETVRALKDELSDLAAIKDDETEKEGEAEEARNTVKAARLRACHSLATAMETLLEDY